MVFNYIARPGSQLLRRTVRRTHIALLPMPEREPAAIIFSSYYNRHQGLLYRFVSASRRDGHVYAPDFFMVYISISVKEKILQG